MIPPSMDPFPRPDADPPPSPAHRRAARWGLIALVLVFAGMGVAISAAAGRLDSALLFVGIPCLLALAIGWIDTEGQAWATVFQVITVLLLLASALLHEGALCVLIASPLVYGTAGLTYWLARVAQGRSDRLAALPLLALVALEGALPGARVNPEQASEASRVVAEACADFEAALERGPRIDADSDRGLLLDLAQYPTPVAASGGGLSVGDAWELTMPAGAIATEVTAAEVVPSERGRLEFEVTRDTARTTRWVDLQTGSLAWEQTDGGCQATMTVAYTRKLDPSFWFGPVTDLFMGAGASAFLNALD